MIQSGEVWPDPGASTASLLVTSAIFHVTSPHVSSVRTTNRALTNLWLGGQMRLGVTTSLVMTGGVVSCTATVLEHITTLVPSAVTPTVTSLLPLLKV